MQSEHTVNETAIEQSLLSLLLQVTDLDFEDEVSIDAPQELIELEDAASFGECGILSSNRGIVLRMKDGRQYTLEINRYR